MGISFKSIHDTVLEVCQKYIDDSIIDGQPERAIVNSITDVDSKITKFCAVFADLRKDFDSRALVHMALVLRQTELVLSRMASSVDVIRGYL